MGDNREFFLDDVRTGKNPEGDRKISHQISKRVGESKLLSYAA